jgi:hypothetical protein
MNTNNYDITSKTELSSYYELRGIAEFFYEESKKFDENEMQSDGYYFYAASITFTTFMFEAYMNYSGYYAGFDWDTEEESLSTLDKFDEICSELGIEFEKGKEPYQTIRNLCSKNFRHSMVHGKTFRNENETVKNVSDVQGVMSDILKKSYLSKEVRWTSYINKSYALKANENVMEIIFKIYESLKDKEFELQRASGMGHPLMHSPYSTLNITGDDDL